MSLQSDIRGSAARALETTDPEVGAVFSAALLMEDDEWNEWLDKYFPASDKKTSQQKDGDYDV